MSGGIIVSIANNVYNTLYGDIQGPMKALLEQAYEGSRKEQLTLWEKIFKPFKLDTNSATIAGIGTIVTAFCMGPLIDFFNRKFSVPYLEKANK